MARPTVAEINLDAFIHNWNLVQTIRPKNHLIPVIKANAYGHDAVAMSRVLEAQGATRVAVALFEEAVQVRQAGFKGGILILGPFDGADIPRAQQLSLTPVVGDREFLLALAQSGYQGGIHLKWDTGMHRLGLNPEDRQWLQAFLDNQNLIRIDAFCTHFLKGDDFGQAGGYSEKQLKCFQSLLEAFPSVKEWHIFNSDSLMAEGQIQSLGLEYGGRPGLCLYGFAGLKNALTEQLRPVMTLKTKIVHLVDVPQGEGVSYNATWKAPRPSRIAVLPIGYADGYPRSLSNKGQVFVRGQVASLVGTVCMDYILIDVTDVPLVAWGDDVELWGENISLYAVAQAAGTITYELMTALTSRVPRRIK